MTDERPPNTPSRRQDNQPERQRDRDDDKPYTLTPAERQHVFDWNGWHDSYEPPPPKHAEHPN